MTATRADTQPVSRSKTPPGFDFHRTHPFPLHPSLCQGTFLFVLKSNHSRVVVVVLNEGRICRSGWRIFAPSPIETMACRGDRSKPPNFDAAISDCVLQPSILYLNRPHLQYTTEKIAQIEARNYVSMLLVVRFSAMRAHPLWVQAVPIAFSVFGKSDIQLARVSRPKSCFVSS